MPTLSQNKTLLLKLMGVFSLLHVITWGMPELPSALWNLGRTLLITLLTDPRAYIVLLTGLTFAVVAFQLSPPRSRTAQRICHTGFFLLSLFCFGVGLAAMDRHVAEIRLANYALTLYTSISLLSFQYLETAELVTDCFNYVRATLTSILGLIAGLLLTITLTLNQLPTPQSIVILGAILAGWTTGIFLFVRNISTTEATDAKTDAAQG